MVGKLKNIQGISWTKTILILALMQVSLSYAGEFYTIIGPDGRPIVVQQPSQPKSKQAEVAVPKPAIFMGQDKKIIVQGQNKPELNSQQNNSQTANQETKKQEVKATVSVPKIAVESQSIKSQSAKMKHETLPKQVHKTEIEVMDKDLHQQVSMPQPIKTEQAVLQPAIRSKQKKTDTEVHALTEQPKQSSMEDAFVIIDDEKYIKNEYLEDKEFNLEGKKRFYAMPEGVIDIKHGATRLQLVEREKGVSQSILQSLFKKNQKQDTGPITLSATYYRISQADAVSGLGQQCFQDKKIKNAKTVDLNKDVNIWPRAPLKDQFDFEIVKVSDAIQNIQINSYASRQNNPTFYWPFVVFLDSKGCVLEGAGGFKNHDTAASFGTHEKMEGVIHIPDNSQYLLLTPLASAIDVEDRALTNQGQLKLIAIR
jgi:hypothetical protein